MKFNIQLSGIASEISGKEIITVEIESISDFHNALLSEIPGLKNYTYMISVNGNLSYDLSLVKQEDNILVFSPIAGG